MCPRMLQLMHEQLTGLHFGSNVDVDEELMVINDSFACGCSIAYLCSRGTISLLLLFHFHICSNCRALWVHCSVSVPGQHPFDSGGVGTIIANILSKARTPLSALRIADQIHVELIDRLTTDESSHRWSIQEAQVSENRARKKGRERERESLFVFYCVVDFTWSSSTE